MKRVLFFDPYPGAIGGAQRTTMLLATGLETRGWTITVATAGPGPYVDALRSVGIQAWPLEFHQALMNYGHQTVGLEAARAVAFLPASWLSNARLLKGRFDIVHTIDHRGQLLLGPAARLAGIPVVWHVHLVEPSRLVNRFCARFARRTVVPSRIVSESVDPRRAGSVQEVINALPAETVAWLDAPAPPIRPRVVSVGRMHPDKGYDVLIEAVGRLRASGMGVDCRIAGPTPPGQEGYLSQLIELRRKLRLDGAVEFLGMVGDIRGLLTDSGVYVQPSRRELEPLAVLEAMAAGLPVVATRVGAVEELLDHRARGLVVDAGDPEGLASAIRSVLTQPDQALRRVEAARLYVGSRCRPDEMIAGIESVYRSL